MPRPIGGVDATAEAALPRRPRSFVKHWFAPGAPHYYCGLSPIPATVPTKVAERRVVAGEITLEPCGACLAMATLQREVSE